MLHADPFSGHLDNADPRTNLFVSGGCKWPTIPALRYVAWSGDAGGIFSFLRQDAGVLFMFSGAQPSHLFGLWTPNVPPLYFETFLNKQYIPGASTYRWRSYWDHPSMTEPLLITIDKPERSRCNQAIAIGDYHTYPPALGNTGSLFALYPVEWYAHEPPGVWPPV